MAAQPPVPKRRVSGSWKSREASQRQEEGVELEGQRTHLDRASVSARGGRPERLTSGEDAGVSLISVLAEPVWAAASVSELAVASAAAIA